MHTMHWPTWTDLHGLSLIIIVHWLTPPFVAAQPYTASHRLTFLILSLNPLKTFSQIGTNRRTLSYAALQTLAHCLKQSRTAPLYLKHSHTGSHCPTLPYTFMLQLSYTGSYSPTLPYTFSHWLKQQLPYTDSHGLTLAKAAAALH